MRVLLDEQLPTELPGHVVDTVAGRGWAGIKNGELLRRMRGHYDVLVTMDRSMEFQQPIAILPFGIILVRARSNRNAGSEAARAVDPRRIARDQTWSRSASRSLTGAPSATVIPPAFRPCAARRKKWPRTSLGPSAPPNIRPACGRCSKKNLPRSACGLRRVRRRRVRFRL
jgi:hypothetical protein